MAISVGVAAGSGAGAGDGAGGAGERVGVAGNEKLVTPASDQEIAQSPRAVEKRTVALMLERLKAEGRKLKAEDGFDAWVVEHLRRAAEGIRDQYSLNLFLFPPIGEACLKLQEFIYVTTARWLSQHAVRTSPNGRRVAVAC